MLRLIALLATASMLAAGCTETSVSPDPAECEGLAEDRLRDIERAAERTVAELDDLQFPKGEPASNDEVRTVRRSVERLEDALEPVACM